MLRKLGIGVLALLGIAVLGVGALVVKSRQPLDAPYPRVVPDTSPEGLARGKVLFHATCAQCNRGPGAERVAGAALTEIPAFIGTFHARNITRHPKAGIGAFEDREIARLLRFGITRDGRVAVMPTYNLSDGDLAAILGFLRSDDPLFDADPSVSPPSAPSLIGGLLV